MRAVKLIEDEGVITISLSWMIHNVLTASRRIYNKNAKSICPFLLRNGDALMCFHLQGVGISVA